MNHMGLTTSDFRKLIAASALTAQQKTAVAMQLATGPAVAVPPTVKQESPLEERFLELWQDLGGPELRREFAFAEPARNFRFDFVHLSTMTAIELEGGGYAAKGRHFTAIGFEQDCVKYNFACHLGYRVFRLTGRLVTVEQVQAIVGKCRGK